MNEFADYSHRMQATLAGADWSGVGKLAEEMLDCWQTGRRVFMCGNGGSAGNAIHLANDFLYGISKKAGSGLRVTALPANPALVMALANDEGYEHVFSMQLQVQAERGDVLIVLSGSGNSPTILRALECAPEMGVHSYAVLGYSGGKAKQLADVPIHFAVDDMQISEDMQMVVGHMLMQWLYKRRDDVTARLAKAS